MPTPATRTPVRLARGTYSNLNSSLSDLQEGEIVYATDQDKLYVKEGAALVSTQATVDPDTAVTDVAQTFTAGQRGEITTLTSGSTVTPDFAASNNFTLTLGASLTIANPTNLVVGQSGSIFLIQDGTGSRTITWGSHFDWAGGSAPDISSTAGYVDRLDYIVRTTTSIHGVITLYYS
tara:strand:+ start:299 stop:832 length:534 start_codon:yes stop_codon:yes gene_type:complete